MYSKCMLSEWTNEPASVSMSEHHVHRQTGVAGHDRPQLTGVARCRGLHRWQQACNQLRRYMGQGRGAQVTQRLIGGDALG